MTTIAIIGTAGRRDDAARLDWQTWLTMRDAVRQRLDAFPRPWHGKSGCAAWADHIAVDLYLLGILDELTLYPPAPMTSSGRFVDSPSGKVSNHYHEAFSRARRVAPRVASSFEELAAVRKLGAEFIDVDHAHGEGFHARNLLVGQAKVVIALTFGEGQVPKDGGTRHTWDNSPAPIKIHIPIEKLQHPPPQQNLFSEGL